MLCLGSFKMADISLTQDESFDDQDDGGEPSDSEEREYEGTNFHQDKDTITLCAKLKKYALLENTRQMVPSILLDIFKDASVDSLTADLPALMDIIAGLAEDAETLLRTDLVQRIPHLAAACVEYSSRVPALGNVVEEHLLPLVVKYLGDSDSQVRKSTHATLLALIEQGLVPRHAIETQVCPKVLHYTHADNLMDYHTDAVTAIVVYVYCCAHQLVVKCCFTIISQPALMSAKLMGKMVPLLGRETTERLFLQRFSELCSNSMFYIRKICASSFGEFCAVVGRDAYEDVLLPCFIELCADEVWGVRKACAEVVMTVSCACSPDSRRDALAPAFARLLRDQSRWVRMSAFQTLGPFISTFADPSIIGLAYNQLGELVLINPAGTEFRINSPAFTDSIMMNFKYHAQEANYDDMTNYENYTTDNKIEKLEERETINSNNFNELTDPSNSEQTVDNDNDNMKEENTTESDISNCNNIEIVIGDVNCSEETTNTEIPHEPQCKGDSDINIEDKVFSDKQEVAEQLAEIINEITLEEKQKTNSETVEEDLDKYNLYQYWYISPDLPLDPSIVDPCGAKECTEDSELFNRLDDIQFNNSFNSTIDETLPLDKTIRPLDETISRSIPTIVEERDTPPQEIVPQILIDHFVSMTDPDLAANTDDDMAYHCAFSLPAVALTLGRNNWYLLQKTCQILASDIQYKIRRTVASSLHELALILGQDMAGKHLLPIFRGFIKDLDEVRIGVLKHLAHFLKLIGPEKRNLCLPRLEKFLQTDNEWNWRFREELANQLLMAVPLFTPVDASKHIAMLAQVLLCDKVYAVRLVALSLVTELVRHVSGDPNLTSCLLLKLAEEFAHSKRWVRRQAFALLCSRLISKNALPPEKFATIIMPHLLDLSWDPVPNVRLAVSRTLARDIIQHEYFADVNSEHHEPVNMVLRRLQADKDRDVRQYANPLEH